MRYLLVILCLLHFGASRVWAQFNCGSNTPTFVVDLSNDPNAAWTSPDTVRIDTCCGAAAPDKCVGFEVILHPLAEGIIFDICDGAIPPGAIYYQVNCGLPTQVGEALCLSGPGPHYITFCKPGNNMNKYCITSIAEPAPGPNIAVNDGCSGVMYVQGYDPDSVTWTSVFPGNIGDYDAYLDCTFGCDTVNVQGQANAPDSVYYQVCGPLIGDCDTLSYCDTIVAYFFSTLEAVISPEQPMVCFGSPGTWIYAGGAGGSPPYSYVWGNGSTADSIFVGVGTYYLEVGDTSGCPPAYDTVIVDSFSVEILADAGDDTTICSSFWPIQLSGSVQGVSTGYWVGGDGVFLPDSTALNAMYQPGFNDSVTGSVDLYLITSQTFDCPPDTDTVTITLVVYATAVSFGIGNALCAGSNNGQAWVQQSPFTQGLNFEWLTSPTQFGDSIEGLGAGTYSVVITDPFGCDSVATITILEPDSVDLDLVTLTDASCIGFEDGEAEVLASGGTAPYAYLWSNGDTGAIAQSLPAGSYNVTVVDSNGCSDSIALSISEPPGIAIGLTGVNVDCFGEPNGAANVTVSGPYSNYQYNWSTGSTSSIVFNLQAGVYSVVVTYGLGCSDSDSIVISQPDELLLNLQTQDITCFSLSDGNIGSSLSGGVLPYSYAWSNASTADSISGLSSGIYQLTVTDFNGCSVQGSASIIEPDSLFILMSTDDASCFGYQDGDALAVPNGGIVPYTFQWSTGSTQDSISGLGVGTYTVVVSDSNGCTDTSSAQIIEPTALIASLSASDVTCNGGNDGSIGISVSGGTPGYSYAWSAGTWTTGSYDSLMAGAHVITITDANGCSIAVDTNLSQPSPVNLQMSAGLTICLNANAPIYAAASGGNGGYQYNWSQGLPNNESHVVNPTQTTTYFVTVTDTFGCNPTVGSVKVTVKPVVFDDIDVSAQPDNICYGETTEITGTYSGNIAGYSVTWTPSIAASIGTFTVSPAMDTAYIMTLTDDCGFTASDTVEVRVHPLPTLAFADLLADGCAPLAVTFDPMTSGYSIQSYAWDFGNGITSTLPNPTVTYFNPGRYQVSFSAITNMGCHAQGDGTGEVVARPRPESAFELNPALLTTDDATVFTDNQSVGALYYEWQTSDGGVYDGENMQHTFPDWGDYEVKLGVENAFGCVDTSVQSVYVKPVLVLEAPTAFTPNTFGSPGAAVDSDDMSNDVFYLITRYVSTFHLVIYNRWGETVFESFDPMEGWDGYYKGNLAPLAMYVWRADIVFVDGTEATQTGNVTLLR